MQAVIDIPSSPEPSSSSMQRRTRGASRPPVPSKKRPRLAPAPSIVEIIELTDDDDDFSMRRPLKRTRRQAGPSQPTPAKTSNAASAFGTPNAEILADAPASVPGSSEQVARLEQADDGGPLFLLASDDEPLAFRPSPGPVAQEVPYAALAHPQSPPPAPQPPAPVDPIDEYLVRVLEIIPDVQPAHAYGLIEQFMRTQSGNAVEFVLHALFEDPSYPKVDKKGKHKRDESDDDPGGRGFPKPKVDYLSKDRAYNCGPHYFERSLEQLMMNFPRIPKPHLRARLVNNRFYAPTYLLLAEELRKDPLPFKLKSTNSVVSKGKAKQDPEFDREREWVLLRVAELDVERDAALAASVNEQEYEDNGEGIDCGCCFSGYPFDQMIQCPEAHLFCKSCMTSYASNLLGEHNPNIVCMDQSGCKLPFPESELSRFLSPKLLDLYYRVKQRKEIEAAGLDNLEECPFCEYKCVIDNEMEKLFRCENSACSAITCRTCKKPDHLPRSCKEVEEDKHLDAQHVIEEAMTQALMRNCPKCQKSFIKEMGCNKMTCPNCYTVSCYICRKVIVGYDHFSNPPPYSGKVDKSKCNLWDPVEKRSDQEVSEAAKRALAELRKSRPDVDESNLKVDIPVARPQRPGPRTAIGLQVDGGGGLPAYMGAGVAGMGGPGLGPLRVGPIAVAGGAGLGMRAGLGALAGLANDPFVFGAGHAHPFMPVMVGGVPPRLGLDAPAPGPVWGREAAGMAAPARGRGAGVAAAPEPAVPLALGRERPVRPAPVRAGLVPVAGPGGGGRRRKGR